MTTPRNDEIPAWLIERLALGELDAAAAADLRRRLTAAGRDIGAELAALAASNQALLAAHPAATIAAVRARAAAERPSPRRWRLAAPLVLAAALVLVWVVPRPPAHTRLDNNDATSEHVVIKGAPALFVYRRDGGTPRKLSDGGRAAPGDLLQLAYRAGNASFGALLSIDGRGQVTVHWPEGAATAAPRLSARGEVKLPFAYELDDAPGFERFFLITSDAPFVVSSVLDAARALAARPTAARAARLELPAPLQQESLALEKTDRNAGRTP